MTSQNPQVVALLKVLGQYMTETAARVVLRGALDGVGSSFETLSTKDLPRVADALGPATRHFVSAAQAPSLKAALRGMVAPVVPAMQRFEIRDENDASRARWAAKAMCDDLGARSFDSQKVATGVSELARNQLSYAGGGAIELRADLSAPKRMVVVAQDRGHGIPNLELVLSGKYVSRTGLGLGLLGIKRMSNDFDVKTSAGGTTIRFEVHL